MLKTDPKFKENVFLLRPEFGTISSFDKSDKENL
jgi:hypothetical protein